MKNHPNAPIKFSSGAVMKNRFMLAPLTNGQSQEDGRLSDEEFKWLTMRAEGGFGIVMTCASHIQEVGKGFSGQLGIFSDDHIKGHQKLTDAIKSHGSLAVIQLHHAGMRSPAVLIEGVPVSAYDNEEFGARRLSLKEVQKLRDDFINAAVRSKKCGYDGVEVHGAHGYILTQFISKEINKRDDEYGGTLTNRSRILFEIVDGIRNRCGKKFMIGVRLSPEKFGMELTEIKEIAQILINNGNVDFLDISLWDSFKLPEEEKYKERTLLEHFTSIDRKDVKLTVAGKISSGSDVEKILNADVDFVTIGRSAILHHDFPSKVIADSSFTPAELPVTEEYLRKEGLSEAFINYLGRWPGFVGSKE